MQANQVSERKPKSTTRISQEPILVKEARTQKCPHCSAVIVSEALACPHCGRSLRPLPENWVSLQDALLFGAILLLVALSIAPVWPEEQIYGKSIQFLVNLGVNLPGSPAEATAFRQQMMNVVQLYQGINLLHYITISIFALLFGLHAVLTRKSPRGYSNAVWVVLGILLLVFPAANLAVSWSMFLSPGVLGTVIASLLVLFSGGYLGRLY